MLLGQVLIPIIMCAVACALQEPQCTSMFDYEHKLLYKLIKIEEEVKSFRQFVDDLKDKEIKRELEQRQEFKDFLTTIEEETKKTFADIRKQAAALNDEQEDVAREQAKDSSQLFKDHEEAIRNLTAETKDSSQLFKDHDDAIRNLTVVTKRLNNVKPIGFSVTAPKETPTSNQISFGAVITNEGAVFDVDAGEFICQTPGFYVFSLTIVKAASHNGWAGCDIRKNNGRLVRASMDPGHSGKEGRYGITNSVYVHLASGDKIIVDNCSHISSFHSYSSFTGHLVRADTV